jgi:hypothetical protein
VFNLNELSSDLARERHLDYVRQAERERRLDQIAATPPSPGLVARCKALVSRACAARRSRRVAGARLLQPICQD